VVASQQHAKGAAAEHATLHRFIGDPRALVHERKDDVPVCHLSGKRFASQPPARSRRRQPRHTTKSLGLREEEHELVVVGHTQECSDWAASLGCGASVTHWIGCRDKRSARRSRCPSQSQSH
jgi:hypothetical protein